MIYLHYFTYRGHADLLTWTCRATLEALAHSPYVLGRDISIVVVDDASNPCPEAAVSELKAMGATYRTSTFKRRGNLNGQDCIMGILSEFKRSMRRKKDIAVKLDCDTLLLGTTWLEQFVKDSSALVTGADDRGCIYGMCYGLKAVLIDALIDLFTRYPVGDRSQEDIYLGYRARRLAQSLSGDGSFLPIPIWLNSPDTPGDNGPHGQLIIYNWSRGLDIAPLYTGFQVINVCNGMHQGKTAMADVRKLVERLVSGKFSVS